jgi:hypothetical protein
VRESKYGIDSGLLEPTMSTPSPKSMPRQKARQSNAEAVQGWYMKQEGASSSQYSWILSMLGDKDHEIVDIVNDGSVSSDCLNGE